MHPEKSQQVPPQTPVSDDPGSRGNFADAPVRVIFNQTAGAARQIEALRPLLPILDEVAFNPAGDAATTATLAREAARQLGPDGIIIAAGGDGTVNRVASGVLDVFAQRPADAPALLILPLGTGNDLARTLGIDPDPEQALQLLRNSRPAMIDAIEWRLRPSQGGDECHGWCINVAAGGFSARVDAAATARIKSRWGSLAYTRSALASLGEMQEHRLTYRLDGKPPRTASVLNAVVANGRYAGGGIVVAPNASPNDGSIDLVLLHPGTMVDLAGFTARLLGGSCDQSDLVLHEKARRVEITADPPIPFNVDGDIVGAGRFVFNCRPGVLKMLTPANQSP